MEGSGMTPEQVGWQLRTLEERADRFEERVEQFVADVVLGESLDEAAAKFWSTGPGRPNEDDNNADDTGQDSDEDEGSAMDEDSSDGGRAELANGVGEGASVAPRSLRVRDIITSYDFETQRWTSYIEKTSFEAEAADAAASVAACLRAASDAENLPPDLTTETPRSSKTGDDDVPATAINQAPWSLWDYGSTGLLGTDVEKARQTVLAQLAPLHELITCGPLTMADLTYFHMLLEETYTRLNRADRLVYQRRDQGTS